MSTPPHDPAQMLAKLFEAGQAQLRQFNAASSGGESPESAADPEQMLKQYAKMQQDLLSQVAGFWVGMLGAGATTGAAAAPAKSDDKRFAAEAWSADPWGDAIKRTYLAYAGFLQNAAESAPVDAKTKDQLRLGVRSFVDAMSPSNFFATNPEAQQVARETQGRSLVEGMQLFYKDLAKGRITTTDEAAFEVGRNIAVTEGAVIFENELIQLIQYKPTTAEVAARPLLMIPPCINKFYIMDLQPENSLVRYALERGNAAFMVSWRQITPELGHLTWDDYLEKGVMKAVDVVLEVSGADKANVLGFCVGGSLLASALGVMAARRESKVASLTLLTTMLDYSDAGEIGSLISEQSVAAKEVAIGRGGVLEGKELAFTFSSLRANDLMWQYVTNSYLKGKAPPAFDMLYWNADSTNLPGPMFCWYVRNLYLENRLREPGGTTQCGVPVDLTRLHVPAFVYASREDHIVPWKTAYASGRLLGGDTTFVLGASGHIAGVINPPAKNKRNYWADGARGVEADRWLETAQSVPGSWWPRWAAWLAQYAGGAKPAAKSIGNRRYRAIEPAPGSYVKQKAG